MSSIIKKQIVKSLYVSLLLACSLFTLNTAFAEGIPHLINYQGKVDVLGQAHNGPGFFKFSLVDDPTNPTQNFWTNDGSTPEPGAEPAQSINIPVNNGLFSIRLGDLNLANMTALGGDIFKSNDLYLRVWFSADGNLFERLDADRQLLSAPFAIRSATADSLGTDNSVASSHVIDDSLVDADINSNAAIAASKIDTTGATNMVTRIIAGSGITIDNTGTGDVTISASGLGGGASSDLDCVGCVGSLDIASASVSESHLSFDPATQAELDAAIAGSSSSDVTCSGCVNTTDIATGAVTEAQLSFDPATQAELDAATGSASDVNCIGCVASSDIADNSVAISDLNFDPATQAELDAVAAGANSDVVCSGCVGSTDIANSSVSTSQLSFDVATQAELDAVASISHVAASNTPTLSILGDVALELDEDAINFKAGSNNAGGISSNTLVALPLVQQKDITLLEPDQMQLLSDAIPFFTVDSYNYPNGITITAVRLATSASSSLAINVEEWVSPDDVAPATIANIATLANFEATVTGSVAVSSGSYVFLDLDTTDVDWAKVTVWYYVND